MFSGCTSLEILWVNPFCHPFPKCLCRLLRGFHRESLSRQRSLMIVFPLYPLQIQNIHDEQPSYEKNPRIASWFSEWVGQSAGPSLFSARPFYRESTRPQGKRRWPLWRTRRKQAIEASKDQRHPDCQFYLISSQESSTVISSFCQSYCTVLCKYELKARKSVQIGWI